MSKELLRITMNEAQVIEACKEFAKARVAITFTEPCSVDVEITASDKKNDRNGVDIHAEVIFTKKRVRAKTTTKEQAA